MRGRGRGRGSRVGGTGGGVASPGRSLKMGELRSPTMAGRRSGPGMSRGPMSPSSASVGSGAPPSPSRRSLASGAGGTVLGMGSSVSGHSHAHSSMTVDPRYVASLKEQIQYLELETRVLKGQKRSASARHGPRSMNASRASNGTQGHSQVGSGLDESLSDLVERCKGLELEHQLELERRDIERSKLREELNGARVSVSEMQRDVALVQARADDMVEDTLRRMEQECEKLAARVVADESAPIKLKEMEDRARKAEQQLSEARSRWATEENELRERDRRLVADLEFSTARVAELEGSNGVDRVRLAELEAMYGDFDSMRVAAESQADAAKAAAEQMRVELAYTRSLLQKAQDNEQTLLDENQQLVESNATISEELRQCRQRLADYASREDMAAKKCKDALVSEQRQQVETDTMRKELLHVQELLSVETSAHRKDAAALASAKAMVQDLTVRFASQSDTLASVSSRADRAEQHTAKLLAQTAGLNTKLDQTELELAVAKEESLKAKQDASWAIKQQKELEHKVHMNEDLQEMNVNELRSVMQSNIELTAKFDRFLKRHQEVPES